MLHFHLSGSVPKPWQPSSSLLDTKFTHPCLCRVTLHCSVSVFICPLLCGSAAELLLSGSAMVRDFSFSLGFGDRPSRRTGIIYILHELKVVNSLHGAWKDPRIISSILPKLTVASDVFVDKHVMVASFFEHLITYITYNAGPPRINFSWITCNCKYFLGSFSRMYKVPVNYCHLSVGIFFQKCTKPSSSCFKADSRQKPQHRRQYPRCFFLHLMTLRVKLLKTNEAPLFINAPRLPKVHHIWWNESTFLPCVPLSLFFKHQDRYTTWEFGEKPVPHHFVNHRLQVDGSGTRKKVLCRERSEPDCLICDMVRLKLNCKQYPRVQIHTSQRKQSLSIKKTKE